MSFLHLLVSADGRTLVRKSGGELISSMVVHSHLPSPCCRRRMGRIRSGRHKELAGRGPGGRIHPPHVDRVLLDKPRPPDLLPAEKGDHNGPPTAGPTAG